MKYQHLYNSGFPKRERGIATILIVVLIGVALTASAIGIMHSMRSAQEKQVAVHAVTHAQNGLWTGVEAMRLYLGGLTPANIDSLATNTDLPISFSQSNLGLGSLVVKITNVAGSGATRTVKAVVVNNHGDARASSAVEVTYEITAGNPAGPYLLPSILNFNDDLKLTSNLTFDNPMTVNVKGNVEVTNANITNLQGINATGSVTVSANGTVNVGLIHSNGDVNLSGTNATATEIKSQGNVTLSGTAVSPIISANGNVTHNASTNTASLRSLANVTVGNNSGNHTLIVAGGGVTINSSYANTVSDLWSVNTITHSSNARLTNVYGQAGLNCLAGWINFATIAINGVFGTNCTPTTNTAAGRTVTQPATVTVNVMTPVPAFNMPSLTVDVFPFREEANYAVTYESGKIKVVVNNVNGLANGTYYVGNGRGICSAVDASNNCTGAITKYMCLGSYADGPCLSYAYSNFTIKDDVNGTILSQSLPSGSPNSSGTFTIEGGGIAPGIWWIDGNVILSTGYNNGTLLATGNIASSNHYRGAVVNYGGEPIVYSGQARGTRTTPYQEVCQAIATGMQAEMSHLVSTYKSRFENQYPSNLCNKTTATYTKHRLGNIALAAGGIRPVALGGNGTTYSGGDISIKANSNVFGTILAGGYFQARNNTAIMGYVSASVQGARRGGSVVKNLSDGDVKIYTNSATQWYAPNEVPWMGSTPCTVGCGTPATSPSSKLLWSRYL